MRKAALSYLPTSRRDTREIRPRHSLSRAQHRTAPYTEHYLSNTSSTDRSVSILNYIPRSFPVYLSALSILVHLSVCPLPLSISISLYLCLLVSLSPSLPPSLSLSLSLSLSFFLSPPLLLGHAGRRNPSSSAFSTAPSPCSRGRRSGRVNERDVAIGVDDGDDDDGNATSLMARATRDVIRRKRKKKRKRLPAARARARERDDPASSYARDSVWATTEERICAVPAQAFVPVLTRHGATVDHPFRRGKKRGSGVRRDIRTMRMKTHACVYSTRRTARFRYER